MLDKYNCNNYNYSINCNLINHRMYNLPEIAESYKFYGLLAEERKMYEEKEEMAPDSHSSGSHSCRAGRMRTE